MTTARGITTERRRLLVLTYHYPPDGAIGGWRWAGMSKYLARRGWAVDIITAAKQPDSVEVPGVTVHYCPRRATLNDRYNAWARQRRSVRADASPTPAHAQQSAALDEPTGGAVRTLRELLGLTLIFPDDGRGWILRASRLARSLFAQSAYDAVVTSGPPHSAHLAGMLATSGSDARRWIDMRDPWAAMTEKSWAKAGVNASARATMIRLLEQIVFSRSKLLIANTTEFAAQLRSTYPSHSVFAVPNGIDPERLPPPAEKFPGLSIAYAGTLYAGRNVSTVMRAITAFLERYPEARASLKLRVAGTMDPAHETQFWSDVAAGALADSVETLGQLPAAAALDLVNRSHVALVLAQDQEMQVPAKLYECVAMGVTTLVVAESSSAAAREARQIGAAACEPNDVEGMCAVIERAWLNRGASVTPSYSFGYEQIAARMDELLSSSPAGALRATPITIRS